MLEGHYSCQMCTDPKEYELLLFFSWWDHKSCCFWVHRWASLAQLYVQLSYCFSYKIDEPVLKKELIYQFSMWCIKQSPIADFFDSNSVNELLMNWTSADGLGYHPLQLLGDKLSLFMAQKLGLRICLQSSVNGFKTAHVRIISVGAKARGGEEF